MPVLVLVLTACESRNWIGFPRRSVTTAVAGLAISALAFTVACSHTSPYRRPGITTPSTQLEGQLSFRVLLIGDAGEPAPQEPVLRSLRRWVQKAPERTLVVFLGDNAYPEGMTPARQQDAERRILSQLYVVRRKWTIGRRCLETLPGEWPRDAAGSRVLASVAATFAV